MKVIAFSLQHIKDRLSNSIIAALVVVGRQGHLPFVHRRVGAFDIGSRNQNQIRHTPATVLICAYQGSSII